MLALLSLLLTTIPPEIAAVYERFDLARERFEAGAYNMALAEYAALRPMARRIGYEPYVCLGMIKSLEQLGRANEALAVVDDCADAPGKGTELAQARQAMQKRRLTLAPCANQSDDAVEARVRVARCYAEAGQVPTVVTTLTTLVDRADRADVEAAAAVHIQIRRVVEAHADTLCAPVTALFAFKGLVSEQLLLLDGCARRAANGSQFRRRADRIQRCLARPQRALVERLDRANCLLEAGQEASALRLLGHLVVEVQSLPPEAASPAVAPIVERWSEVSRRVAATQMTADRLFAIDQQLEGGGALSAADFTALRRLTPDNRHYGEANRLLALHFHAHGLWRQMVSSLERAGQDPTLARDPRIQLALAGGLLELGRSKHALARLRRVGPWRGPPWMELRRHRLMVAAALKEATRLQGLSGRQWEAISHSLRLAVRHQQAIVDRFTDSMTPAQLARETQRLRQVQREKRRHEL